MKIYAVVVGYEPNLENLDDLIRILAEKDCHVILADNSEKRPVTQEMLQTPCTILSLHGNQGIAKAQNEGIQCALKKGAECVGFFDQDSRIDGKLLDALLAGLQRHPGAVVAPVSVEADTGQEYPSAVLCENGMSRDVFCLQEKTDVQVDLVISSGTFVWSNALQKIGGMDEDFFIDFVDIEWCLRCKKKQVPIYVVPSAVMKHKIGNTSCKVGPITISVHSPYRTYYKVRNSFLMRKKGASFLFLVQQILPAVAYNLFLLFDKEKGKEYRKFYFAGLRDGLQNRTGEYHETRR